MRPGFNAEDHVRLFPFSVCPVMRGNFLVSAPKLRADCANARDSIFEFSVTRRSNVNK